MHGHGWPACREGRLLAACMMIPLLEVSRGRSLSGSALEGESPSRRRPRLAVLTVEPRACCRLVKLVFLPGGIDPSTSSSDYARAARVP